MYKILVFYIIDYEAQVIYQSQIHGESITQKVIYSGTHSLEKIRYDQK